MLQRNNPSQLRNLFSYNRKKASAVTNRSLRFTVHCHHIRTQISTRSCDVFRSIKIKPVDETLSLLISLEKREQKRTSLWGARVNQVNQRLSGRRREKGALHGVQNRDLWRVCGPWTPVEHIPPSPSPRETRRMTTDVGTGAPGRRCRPPRLVTKPENMCFGCLMAEGRDPLPPSAFSSLSLSSRRESVNTGDKSGVKEGAGRTRASGRTWFTWNRARDAPGFGFLHRPDREEEEEEEEDLNPPPARRFPLGCCTRCM